MPTQTGSLDLKAGNDASKTATNYITEISTTDGIKVHNTNDTSNYAQLNSTGMEVVQGGNSVAKFGADVRIGQNGLSHIEMDFNSLRLIDRENNEYFSVEDLRNEQGTVDVVRTIIADGETVDYIFSPSPTNTNYTVTVSDSSGGTITKYDGYLSFTTPPNKGAIITITYTSDSRLNKVFTFGTRDATSEIGAMSYAEGVSVTASGYDSHAEGNHTVASGTDSHAEGFLTRATNNMAHAEGVASVASGWWSHAQNSYTIAASMAQTAIGKHNIEDDNDAYALIIGNGHQDARSNALTVDWNGNVTVNNHSSPIGTIKRGEPSAAVSVPDKTFKALCSVSLEAGTWIVICTVRAPSNATGFRMANLATTAAVNACNACIPAVSANVTQFDFTKIVEPTATTTYYLNVYHNAGTALNYPTGSTNYITAIRIL